MLLRQPPETTTFITPAALLTDSNAETPLKAPHLQLLSWMAEMRHYADKQANAAQQRYERYHEAQVRNKTGFPVDQMIYADGPPVVTSTAHQMAVRAYSELLLRPLGPYCVTYNTSLIINIEQKGVSNRISVDLVSLAFVQMQLQGEIVDDDYNQSISETSVRYAGKHNDQPGQSQESGSQTQEYTVKCQWEEGQNS